MQDDVLIILNEHESRKRERAEALASALQERLAVHRVSSVDHTLPEIVAARNPRLLILDYILGEYGTAVDLIQACSEAELSTEFIVWTDEPSAQVAVSVMKLGAQDYIDISSTRAVEKAIEAVSDCLGNKRGQSSSEARGRATKTPLIFEAKAAKSALLTAQAAVARAEPILVLYGPSGAGRSALAEKLHEERKFSGVFHHIDYDLFTGAVSDILGEDGSGDQLLSYAASVMLDHTEAGFGGIIEAAAERINRLWPNGNIEDGPMLLVGTSSEEHAAAWQRLCGATVVELPALAERGDDLLGLLQLAIANLPRETKKAALSCSTVLVEIVSGLTWPGNIKQFLAAATDAASIERRRQEKSSCPEEIDKKQYAALNTREQVFLEALLAAKLRWERYQRRSDHPVAALAARQALLRAGGDLRRAAAMLGSSVLRVQQALGEAPAGSATRGQVDGR